MRRSLVVVVALGVLATACGGDDASTDSVTDVSLERQSAPPTASAPEVQLPSSTPTELVVTELAAGEGAEAVAGDTVYVSYVGVRSEDGTEFDSNYGGEPLTVTLGAGEVIDGWEEGLVGARAGQRLQLDIPADLAYGDEPRPGGVIQPGDALSFVIDVLAVATPTTEPTPDDLAVDDEPVVEMVVDDVTIGDGPPLEDGQQAVVHLLLARGDTGQVLQSTWQIGSPQTFTFADGGAAPFLLDGLAGMRAGGRRILTLPFADVLDESDATEASVPVGTDFLVVADLLASY